MRDDAAADDAGPPRRFTTGDVVFVVNPKFRIEGRVEGWQDCDLIRVIITRNPLRMPGYVENFPTVFSPLELTLKCRVEDVETAEP